MLVHSVVKIEDTHTWTYL